MQRYFLDLLSGTYLLHNSVANIIPSIVQSHLKIFPWQVQIFRADICFDKYTARQYNMDDGEYSWDDDKAASNFLKHGVSFEAATDIFKDPFAIDWLDESENYGEIRYRIIGVAEVAGLVLFVAYTMRDDVTRIISAREAAAYEKRRYYEENSY